MRLAATTRRRDDTDADSGQVEPDEIGSRGTTAIHLARWLAACCLLYAGYRAYYAAGGTLGMIGEPVSEGQFRAINAVGSLLIVVFSVVLPLVVVHVRRLNRVVPVLGWIGAVGCCVHALVDVTLRVLSLTGRHPTELPTAVWRSFDRRTADLQDLLLNEPWFLLVGLLWASLALTFVHPAKRRTWVVSAVVACLLLSVVGVLSGVGEIGSVRAG
jgi:hypothetical protein